jgi:hypothetical protein
MIIRSHLDSDSLKIPRLDSSPADRQDRHAWLCALSDCGLYIFHGSQRGGIEALLPYRESSDITEFGNRQQIFATPDIIWAIWFAVLDRNQIRGTANSCFIDRANRRSVYDFAIDAASYEKNPAPLKPGWIYLLDPESFTSANTELGDLGLPLAEYGAADRVVPLAKLQVYPDDFPYTSAIRAVTMAS